MTASAPQSRDLAQRLQHAADLLNTGRPADARLAAERVLETHPDHPLALYLLGGAAKLEGHFRAAERSYRKALEIDPTQPQVRLALAKALHADGRLAAAIAELKRATEDQPRYLAAWLELGDRLLGSGDPEAAVEAFSAALRLKPGSPSAETGLARARLASGDVETARAALEDIVRREPNRVASRFYLGRARRLDGEPEAAVAALRPLVSQNDAAAEALQEAARAAYEAGDEDGALRLLERAAASAPYAAGVHRDLAQIRFMTGRDDALASFERVLDAGRAPPELLSVYVATAIAVDASDSAARRFERALGETEHPLLRDAEGRLALARGRAADAVASFRRAVAADQANAIYVQNLAAALLEAGDPKAAVETCERALAAAPYDQALLAYIVTGQMMLGDATAGGLVDLETFTRRIELSPPAGHATIEAFNAALAEGLVDRPPLCAVEPPQFFSERCIERLDRS
ncbi:MAG: tetratricopeptide repeat protein, partial [Pseudomonadota bacterium]